MNGFLSLLQRALAAVALTVSLVPAYNTAQAVEPELDRPNVLVVVTDDQPLGMMGAMPATRRWMGSGTRYPNAVASTPLCCPARASILSGRYVHNHGVRTLDDAHRFDFSKSLPTTMERAGYTTGIAGKFFNYWNLNTDDPGTFDRFAVFSGGYESDIRADVATHADIAPEVPGQVSYSGDTTETTRQASLSMLRGFEADDTKPWMLYMAPYAPHGPKKGEHAPGYGDAPALHMAAGEANLADKPPHVRDVTRKQHTARTGAGREYRRMYRSLRVVDDMMADVRAQLEASGELENTLVVFTSDNGYLLGQHGLVGKKEAYEGSLRVPMYVAGPGVARGVDSRIVGLTDIAATAYDAAGVHATYPVDGQSMLGPATRKRILIEHFGGGSGDQNVGDWFGWWRPGSMYRFNRYGSMGTEVGCDDGRARTICQRYRNAPGAAEAYRGTAQNRNLLQNGASAQIHRRWASSARRCVGSGCLALEAMPGLRLAGSRLVGVDLQGPRRFRSGQPRVVRVVARNVSGRRLPFVRLRLERNPQWTVRRLDRGNFRRVAPGERVSTRWRVTFRGTGPVSLSAWARFPRGSRQAWDAAPVVVR